ncbi:MAG: glycerophosphodiester phosphodiesterase, partial [Pyrinomonadaceae bacterium]
ARAVAAYARETVPTLKQVLKLYESTTGPIYIELKCNDSNYGPLATAVCEMIRDSPILRRMIVKSFKLAAIPTVRHLLPEVQTAALFEPSIMTILRKRRYIIAMAREFGAHQISLHYSLATSKLTALAAEAQMPVTIWTADNPTWFARCRDRGIGSLITNDPQNLITTRKM